MNLEELDKFVEEYGMEEMERVSYYIISGLMYCVLVGCLLALCVPFINLFLKWW